MMKAGPDVFTASYLARVSSIDAANLRCPSDWSLKCVLSTVNIFPVAMEAKRVVVQIRNDPAPGYYLMVRKGYFWVKDRFVAI